MRCTEETGRAVVRFHEGKLSEAERNAVIMEAAERFCKAIIRAGKGDVLFGPKN